MRSGVQRFLPELVFGAVAAVGSVVLVYQSADLPERSAFFPHAVLWCLAAAGLGIFGEGLFRALKAGEEADATAGRGWIAGVVMPALILLASAVLLYAVGFYLTAPVMIVAIYVAHSRLATGSGPALSTLARGAALALAMTAVMYLVFDILIGLPAPAGALI